MRLPSFITHWIIDYWRWFALGVVAIILSLGYVLLLAGKITAVRTEGLVKRNEIAQQLQADMKYRDALQVSATSFDQKISAADQASIAGFIPTGSDFPTLLLTMQDIVQRAGLSLTDLAVTEIGQVAAAGTTADVAATGSTSSAIAQAATVQGVSLRIQDVALTVSGIKSYEDIKSFVSLIESSRRLFDMVSISFNLGANNQSADGTAAVGTPLIFSLRTYYLPATQ